MTTTEEQARELISAWARHNAPSAGLRARTWEAVEARASAGELGPELTPEPSAATTVGKTLTSRLRLLLGGLGATAIIVGLGWGLGAGQPAPSSGAEVERAEARAPTSTAAPPPADDDERPPPGSEAPRPSAPAAAELTTTTEPATPRAELPPARAPARPKAGAAVPAPEPDALAVEMQLLGAARTSLKAGEVDAALASLDEHARRFPRGALASERELSRVTALCKANRVDDAEAVALRFVAARPGSTHSKRLHNTCVGERLAATP